MKKILHKLGQLLSSPFIIVLAFSFIGNILQIIIFYCQKNVSLLDDSNLASLNFGIYLANLTGILTSAFYQANVLKLSSMQEEEKQKYLALNSKKSIYISCLLATVVILVIGIFNFNSYRSDLFSISLIYLFTIVGQIVIYPKALIISRKNYIYCGLVDLIAVFLRLFATLFLLRNSFVASIFISLLVGTFIALFLYMKKSQLKCGILFNTKLNGETLKIRSILYESVIQLMISYFYIADGIILKELLTNSQYITYTSYAFLYKFPLFISTSISIVLLSETADKKAIAKTLLRSIFIVVSAYSAIILLDIFSEGFILKYLNYGDYLIPGLTYIFGSAWAVNTLLSFLFIYTIKLYPKSKITFATIFTYVIALTIVMLTFSHNLSLLMTGILIIGITFTVLALINILLKRNSKTT